jgi:GTPase SAR1 family protein
VVGLLERGRELARIKQAITALGRGQGGVLVIQGAAGIGKSALLHVLCQHAEGQGVQMLTARASELERDFGFGVVRQLLEARIVRADGPYCGAVLVEGGLRDHRRYPYIPPGTYHPQGDLAAIGHEHCMNTIHPDHIGSISTSG